MWRNSPGGRLRSLLVAGLVVAGVAAVPQARAADDPFNAVDPVALPLDRNGVWTLHFAYLPVRILPVDTPAGKKTAWYMVYKVWNTSDTPVTFVPMFELVTKDGELRSFLDDIRPAVLDQIRKVEDPTGELKLKSSVSISREKIPVTKPDSVPRAVYGVAVWLDVAEKAPNTNHFSVYVGGLSNGVAVSEKGGGETITHKTLQIDFFRPTNNVRPQLTDIRPNENGGLGPDKWIYRALPARRAAAPAEGKNGK